MPSSRSSPSRRRNSKTVTMTHPIQPQNILPNLNPHRAKTQNLLTQILRPSTVPKQILHPIKKRREPNSTSNNWKPSPPWKPSLSTSNTMSRNSATAPLPSRSQPSARPNAPSLHSLWPSRPPTSSQTNLQHSAINHQGICRRNQTLPPSSARLIPITNFPLFP